MSNNTSKVALITGGGTGIGRSTALQLASSGWQVIIAGRREGPLKKSAEAANGNIAWQCMDLGDTGQRQVVVDKIQSDYGRLDALINNAAYETSKTFDQHSSEEIQQNIHINLTATLMLTHALLPLLRSNAGCIVNVSSAAAHYAGMPPAQLPVYSAAKAGMNQFTRVLATEVGSDGVRVNAVCPGLTDTEIAESATSNPEAMQYLNSITPLGRVGQPQDVAKVICFLCSENASWVTGQIIDASGGFWL